MANMENDKLKGSKHELATIWSNYELNLEVTFVSMLSIQSRTKSGWPERISSSVDESYNITLASIWHSGKIDKKCSLRH
jgi:hypothetical protein